ncbi:MAG: zinc ABC transporter substrate-binding protein [Verrucomicrobiota bacterium]
MLPFRKTVASLCLLGALLLAAPGARAAGKIQVLTSFLPVYCFTANVAGDLAHVENLLPAGAGPHDYQFSPRDMSKLKAADLLIINGLGMEEWLGRAMESTGGKNSRMVVEISAGLKSELIRGKHVHEKGGKHDHAQDYNPHIWLDPVLATHAVTNILKALQKADPANAAGYAANAARYVEQLRQLDADIRAGTTPLKKKPFVALHNAFPYLVKRYDLNLIGVIEEVPEVNPSPRYLKELMGRMRDKKVGVIFVDSTASNKLAVQIASDLKIKTAVLDTLESGPLTPRAYEDGMRKNLSTLRENLK